MNKIIDISADRLKWNPPQLYSLSLKRTASGGDPAQAEDDIYDPQDTGSA